MIDVVEHVGRRLVDRGGARAGRGVWRRAGMDRAGLEAVFKVERRRRAVFHSPRQRRRGGAIANDAAVDAAPRQFSAEPAELDLRAAVHDHFDARGFRRLRRLVVADAQLHPDHFRADRDRALDHAGRFVRGPKHVDHVDPVRNVAQRAIGLLAEQGLARNRRIDGDHAIAFALQVLHDEVAWPIPVRRGADHRNGLHPLEDRADLGVGIGDWLEIGHG